MNRIFQYCDFSSTFRTIPLSAELLRRRKTIAGRIRRHSSPTDNQPSIVYKCHELACLGKRDAVSPAGACGLVINLVAGMRQEASTAQQPRWVWRPMCCRMYTSKHSYFIPHVPMPRCTHLDPHPEFRGGPTGELMCLA
jgi:hypothetical protein